MICHWFTPVQYIYILLLFKIIDKYPTIEYHSYFDDIQLHCRFIDPNNDLH